MIINIDYYFKTCIDEKKKRAILQKRSRVKGRLGELG